MHVYKFLKFAFEKLKTVVLQTAEKSLTGELKTGVKGEVIPHCKIGEVGQRPYKGVILQRAKKAVNPSTSQRTDPLTLFFPTFKFYSTGFDIF